MSPNLYEHYFTPTTIARYHGVSHKKVTKAIQQGDLNGQKVRGKWRVHNDAKLRHWDARDKRFKRNEGP